MPGLQEQLGTTGSALFEHQAARALGTIAVDDDRGPVCDRELGGRARRVTASLRQCRAAVGTGVRVLLARSLGLAATLLAVLRAGAVCVPFAPAGPSAPPSPAG